MTNGYDARVLITTIKRIVDPDRYYSKNQPEYTIFPPSKYDQERFIHSIEANEEWKRSFLTLHQMMKWLKGIIFLVSSQHMESSSNATMKHNVVVKS